MKTNALPGGNVGSFLNYGDTILADIGAELYYSTNHGKSWNPVFIPALLTDIFLSDADGESVLFSAYNPVEDKINWFRSDDFFQTVLPLTSPDTLPFYEMIFAFGHIYARNINGIFRTSNNGADWIHLTGQFFYRLKVQGQKLLSSDGSAQLYYSDNEGDTWDTLLTANGYIRDFIVSDDQIYVFTHLGCQVSPDGGQSWQFYVNNVLGEDFSRFIWHNGSIFGSNYHHQIIKSSDLGQTWTQVAPPAQSVYPVRILASSGNTLLIGGLQSVNSPGMHRSIDNGNSWIPVSMGIRAASGKFRKTGNDLHIAGMDGVYRREINGEFWVKEAFSLPEPNYSFWQVSDYLKINGNYIISDRGVPWTSTDGGNNWEIPQITHNQHWYLDEITDLETIGNKVLAWGVAEGHAYKYLISEDNGLSFNPLNLGGIFAMDIDNQQVYALNSSGTIFRSDDACETWQIHSQSLPRDSCIAWSPLEFRLFVRDSVFFVQRSALYSSHDFRALFISRDGGQTWDFYCQEDSPSGLTWGNNSVRDVVSLGNNLAVATRSGIYISENGGQNWVARNEGLWHPDIEDLIVHDGYLWAATLNGGVWRRPLSELELHVESETRAEKENWNDALKIYPNPAAERLFVEGNKEAGAIEIRDLAGRLLIQKNINAGGITPLETASLKPGVYQVIFTGQSGGRVVKKVAIL